VVFLEVTSVVEGIVGDIGIFVVVVVVVVAIAAIVLDPTFFLFLWDCFFCPTLPVSLSKKKKGVIKN
jgi:hypothetical protein